MTDPPRGAWSGVASQPDIAMQEADGSDPGLLRPIVSWLILSWLILSWLILSWLIVSWLIVSWLIVSWLIVSWLILPWLILPWLVVSWLVVSWLVVSWLVVALHPARLFVAVPMPLLAGRCGCGSSGDGLRDRQLGPPGMGASVARRNGHADELLDIAQECRLLRVA